MCSCEADLCIEKKCGRGIAYHINGKGWKSKSELKRIKNLVISPLRKHVRINKLKK